MEETIILLYRLITSPCFIISLVFLSLFSAKLFAAEEWRAIVLPELETSKINLSVINTIKNKEQKAIKQKITPAIQQVLKKVVEETITAQLLSADVEVIDKALLLTDIKTKRDFNNIEWNTEQELFLIEHHDINLAVRYHIDILKKNDINKSKNIQQWQFTLSSYFVDLETKNKIETYSEKRDVNLRVKNCSEDCLTNWFSQQVRNIAQDVGAILVEKLQNLPRRYRYKLEFHDFLTTELITIHSQLTHVESFISAKLLQELDTKQTLLHQTSGRKYRYVSLLASDEIDVLLQQYFETNDISVKQVSSNSRNFIYKRASTPHVALYIMALLFFILVILLTLYKILVMKTKTKKHKDLLKKTKRTQAKEMQDKAERLFKNGQYKEAIVLVEKALGHRALLLDTQNEELEQLKLSLLDYIQGEECFYLAQQSMKEQPNKALKLLAQAQLLTPSLVTKILSLKTEINKNSQPIKGAVVGLKGLSSHYIFVDESICLGRKITDFQHSFSIDYQRISREGKQCQFVRQGNNYFLIDQQSSNGTMLDGVNLSAHKLTKLTDKAIVLVGGEIDSIHSRCQLDCRIFGKQSPALSIKLNLHALALMNPIDKNKAWDSMDVDMTKNWVLMANEINLGISKEGSLDLGCTEGGKALAKLIYDDGFYLEPIAVGSPLSSSVIDLTLNGQIVYSRLALEAGFVASLNGCEFSFKAAC